MASKKDIYEGALDILRKHNVAETKPLFIELKELLEPKKGGNAVDLSEYVTFDDMGKAVKISCRLSGVEFEANATNFYSDKNSKIECANGDMVYPHSREAIKVKNDFAKTIKASKDAITADVMNEVITPAEGKERMAALPTEPDYSMVGKTPVEAPAAE